MLGGLARWLRMLGYVTEYDPKADDNSLIQSSQVPDSVLLTRDQELHNRALGKNIHSVLIIGGTEEARLGQLARTTAKLAPATQPPEVLSSANLFSISFSWTRMNLHSCLLLPVPEARAASRTLDFTSAATFFESNWRISSLLIMTL